MPGAWWRSRAPSHALCTSPETPPAPSSSSPAAPAAAPEPTWPRRALVGCQVLQPMRGQASTSRSLVFALRAGRRRVEHCRQREARHWAIICLCSLIPSCSSSRLSACVRRHSHVCCQAPQLVRSQAASHNMACASQTQHGSSALHKALRRSRKHAALTHQGPACHPDSHDTCGWSIWAVQLTSMRRSISQRSPSRPKARGTLRSGLPAPLRMHEAFHSCTAQAYLTRLHAAAALLSRGSRAAGHRSSWFQVLCTARRKLQRQQLACGKGVRRTRSSWSRLLVTAGATSATVRSTSTSPTCTRTKVNVCQDYTMPGPTQSSRRLSSGSGPRRGLSKSSSDYHDGPMVLVWSY